MILELTTINEYFAGYGWVDFGITLGVTAILLFAVWFLSKRWIPRILYSISLLGLIASSLFGLRALSMVLLVITISFITTIIITNERDLRKRFANASKDKSRTLGRGNILPRKERIPEIYDTDELYHEISVAVEHLSMTKTGALITFEGKRPLNDAIKNGVLIKAPVTSELLETIFYPGTRLHDGAVVIRDNMVLAASVYYTATTKPLNGRYGSRHRAAIGISDNSDSITVVVSEETGRISIAKNGELETVSLDNFSRVFREYMENRH